MEDGGKLSTGGVAMSTNAEWPRRRPGRVPAEELARRQGVRPIETVDDLALPDLFETTTSSRRSSPTSTPPGVPTRREPAGR
jgi:hypothetical protein